MNYFSWFNKIFHIQETRSAQLKDETIIDDKLQNCKDCNQEVLNYFFLVRKLNRITCNNLYNSNIIHYPEIMIQNLDTISNHQTQMLAMFDENKNTCQELTKINTTLQDMINQQPTP